MPMHILDRLINRLADLVIQFRGPPATTDHSRDFDRLVKRFVRLARRYNALDFAGPGGTLELHRRVPAVTRVRLESPKIESLRLATVLIDAEGLTDIGQHATMTASSILGRHREVWDQRLLFDPTNTATAVHTKKQQRPWLKIAFDRPVDVT